MSKHEFNVYGLPTHELPLFQEKAGREWVDYGFDNGYGDYLRDLYLGSSIQSAVVSGVSEMIYGEGLDATDREQKPDQWLKTQRLLENSDENILRQLCFDLKLYGQCYVQVIWNRVRTEIAELRFIAAHSVRSGIADARAASIPSMSPRIGHEFGRAATPRSSIPPSIWRTAPNRLRCIR
jgi:hypothetical protein